MKTKLRVSRITHSKMAANKIHRWFKKHGATALKITGVRGSYKVSAWMPICEFAEFCSVEAKGAFQVRGDCL